jgi:hypothetical protein
MTTGKPNLLEPDVREDSVAAKALVMLVGVHLVGGGFFVGASARV